MKNNNEDLLDEEMMLDEEVHMKLDDNKQQWSSRILMSTNRMKNNNKDSLNDEEQSDNRWTTIWNNLSSLEHIFIWNKTIMDNSITNRQHNLWNIFSYW